MSTALSGSAEADALSSAQVEYLRSINQCNGKAACVHHLRTYLPPGSSLRRARQVYDRLNDGQLGLPV